MMGNHMMRYFMAIILIGFGGMLVLDNLGIIESDIKELWHFVYPTFFLVYGFVSLIRYFKEKKNGWMFASFLIIFGSLLLLGRLDVLTFRFMDILKLWPLLIIYAGFGIFRTSRKYGRTESSFYIGKNKVFDYSIGDHEYKEDNWRVKPMTLHNVAGDYFFNFAKAFIPDEEIPIAIKSLAGDIQMIIPENLEIRVNATVKAGEINILDETAEGINRNIVFETPGYEEATRKIDLTLDLKAGAIRINRV